LAGKKTRKRKRRKSQLRVFVVSLLIVLFAGSAAMLAYSEAGAPKTAKSPLVMNFDSLGQTQDTDSAGEQTDTGEAGSAAVQDTEADSQEQTTGAADEMLAENERLFAEAAAKGENVYLLDCADSERVTFAFAGDILLDDAYAMMFRYRSRGSDINDTFSADLLERMRGADVFMLNNEFPFSKRGTPTEGKTFTFRANPDNIEMYAQLGVDIVSLANNHAYDFGKEALLDTFTTLETAGIPYVGAGRDLNEAKKPVYFIANGMKIGIVSATQI